MEPDKSPDKFQQAWQAQASQTRVTIDADLLRKEVQRNQRDFQATIFSRDMREVVVALLMIPSWFYLGARTSSPWTWYLTVPVLVWIAGFMLVYRVRHPQKPSLPGESLRECVKDSLSQVEDQIWLLRNVFWWYLLPPSISLLAFFIHVFWRAAVATNDWLAGLAAMTFSIVILFAVYGFVYYLNQFAVRRELEPRRQELLALLASLEDETSSNDAAADGRIHDDSGRAAAIENRASAKRSGTLARTLAVMVLLAALTAIGSVGAFFAGRAAAGYPKLSPFAAVRWQDSQPEVQVGDEWFKLVSLDELPVEQILAFSRQTYGDLWQKRFEEDLVELLSRMGHRPQESVTLEVQSLTSAETRTLEGVPMTSANCSAITAAAQARAVQIAPEVLQSYEGVYAISPQFALTVTLEGDKLMVQATGQQKLQVYPESATKFAYKVVDAQLTFAGDKQGKAELLILHQNGANQVATRQD